jgi:hypothetical protein
MVERFADRISEVNRNKVNIWWKGDIKRFTLPISTLLTKVVSVIRGWNNGVIISVNNLEPSRVSKYFFPVR